MFTLGDLTFHKLTACYRACQKNRQAKPGHLYILYNCFGKDGSCQHHQVAIHSLIS
jgi:hypothetical protein